MLALVIATFMELAEPDVEPAPAFLDSGGIHLAVGQSVRGAVFAALIYGTAANNVSNRDGYVAAAVAAPLLSGVGAILAGHFLRPSPSAAYESMVLGWAGMWAGFALGDLWLEQQPQTIPTRNTAWPVRAVFGFFGNLVASTIALFPQLRDPHGWQPVAVLGTLVASTVAIFLYPAGRSLPAGPGFYGDVSHSLVLVAPLFSSLVLHMLLRAVSPESEVEITPAPMPGGDLGVSLGGRW